MKQIIKIAWRNLWRNKRRTLITVSSIFFALFYAILMQSFQLGTYNRMLDNIVSQFSGHLQIQDKEYLDNPSIDYSFAYTDSIIDILSNNSKIKDFFPIIRSGILASSGENSKVAMIMGVDWKKELKIKGLNKNIAQYYIDSTILQNFIKNIDENNAEILQNYNDKYFNSKADFIEELSVAGFDTAKYFNEFAKATKLANFNINKINDNVLIGCKLAEYLDLTIGDSIILFGQGFRGATAVGKYKIAGLLNFPIDEYNRMAIYMPIKNAQILLSSYDVDFQNDTTFYVNYIAISTTYETSMNEKDYAQILNVKTEIENNLTNKYLTVVGWRNLNKKLVQTIQIGDFKSKIFIIIFYLIIGFGVLGTIMMMVAERKREFGVMMALGMRKRFLSLIVTFEMFFMGLISIIIGLIITFPITILGHNNPIKLHGDIAERFQSMNMEPVLLFAKFNWYILGQIETVFLIILIVLFYAIFKINKLKIISSLRA